MAKAKKGDVWAARFKPPVPPREYGPIYMLYPFEPQPWCGDEPDPDAVWMGSIDFERLWPQCKLAPGGGPVKVR